MSFPVALRRLIDGEWSGNREVGFGSKPESAFLAVMSASPSCGHNAKSGFVSTEPLPDLKQVQQADRLFDHLVGSDQ